VRKYKDKIWFFATIAVLLIGYFVLGPIVQTRLVDIHQPYLIVDPDSLAAAEQVDVRMCELPPYIPIEMTDKDVSEGTVVHASVVPIEYMEYVHYPDSWDKWWNLYNPENPISQPFKTGMMVVMFGCLGGLVGYNVYLWRTGRWKEIIQRFKP